MAKSMFVRHAYNYDMDKVSEETGLHCLDESRAIQSGKDDADINVIVKRFGISGQLPQGVRMPTYEDFGDVIFDYRSALDAIRDADASFMKMPADVRARFQNDPATFVDFCSDPANIEEARKMGLAVPKKEDSNVSDRVEGAGKASGKADGDSGKGVEGKAVS